MLHFLYMNPQTNIALAPQHFASTTPQTEPDGWNVSAANTSQFEKSTLEQPVKNLAEPSVPENPFSGLPLHVLLGMRDEIIADMNLMIETQAHQLPDSADKIKQYLTISRNLKVSEEQLMQIRQTISDILFKENNVREHLAEASKEAGRATATVYEFKPKSEKSMKPTPSPYENLIAGRSYEELLADREEAKRILAEAQSKIAELISLGNTNLNTALKRELANSQVAYALFLREVNKAINVYETQPESSAALNEPGLEGGPDSYDTESQQQTEMHIETQAEIDARYRTMLSRMNVEPLKTLLSEERTKPQTEETRGHIQLIEEELAKAQKPLEMTTDGRFIY